VTTAFGDGDIDRDGTGEDDRMATEAMGEMEKIAAVCRGNGDCGNGDIDGESEKRRQRRHHGDNNRDNSGDRDRDDGNNDDNRDGDDDGGMETMKVATEMMMV